MTRFLLAMTCVGVLVAAVVAQQNSKLLSDEETKALIAKCRTQIQKQPSLSLPDNWIGEGEKYHGGPTVAFKINEDGTVSDVKLKRSSGVKKLDQAVLKQMRNTMYKAMPGCPGIETQETMLIHFR